MQETKMVFEKLYKFIGKDIKSLIDRPDGLHCFRLHKNRVYYVSEKLMKKATNVSSVGRWRPHQRHLQQAAKTA
jgi:60S ribosome subunit biogenesis protein NIP7